MLSVEEMKDHASAAAMRKAATGGAEVHSVTLAGEPARVDHGLWRVKVRLIMLDGTPRAFECDSTDREVFTVREVTP